MFTTFHIFETRHCFSHNRREVIIISRILKICNYVRIWYRWTHISRMCPTHIFLWTKVSFPYFLLRLADTCAPCVILSSIPIFPNSSLLRHGGSPRARSASSHPNLRLLPTLSAACALNFFNFLFHWKSCPPHITYFPTKLLQCSSSNLHQLNTPFKLLLAPHLHLYYYKAQPH